MSSVRPVLPLLGSFTIFLLSACEVGTLFGGMGGSTSAKKPECYPSSYSTSRRLNSDGNSATQLRVPSAAERLALCADLSRFQCQIIQYSPEILSRNTEQEFCVPEGCVSYTQYDINSFGMAEPGSGLYAVGGELNSKTITCEFKKSTDFDQFDFGQFPQRQSTGVDLASALSAAQSNCMSEAASLNEASP